MLYHATTNKIHFISWQHGQTKNERRSGNMLQVAKMEGCTGTNALRKLERKLTDSATIFTTNKYRDANNTS